MIGGRRIHRGPIERLITAVRRAAATVGRVAGQIWRRSVQTRVIVSTLVLSFVVLLILGFVLISQITGRLLDAKEEVATDEIARMRAVVERVLSSGESNTAVQNRLARARSLLTDQDTESPQTSSVAGSFDSVLVVPGEPNEQEIAVGPVRDVPTALRKMVAGG
ncbi:two-component sensor histidine kinase, partial [Gordonia sihwensis]